MKGHLLVLLSALSFSVIGVMVKTIGDSVPLMTIVFLRLLIAFLFLLAVVPLLDRNTFRVSRKDLKDYAFIGLLVLLAVTTFVSANMFGPVQNAILIVKISPFFVFIFASIMLKERVTRKKIIALVIAFAGLLIINPFQAGPYWLGNLLALCNAVIGGLLVVEMRKEGKTHGIGDVMWFFLFATLFALPLPFLYGFSGVVSAAVPLLVLGVVGTGMAFLFLNLALERIEAEESSIIAMVTEPLFAISLAVLLINETINLQTMLGGAILIGAGIYLETHRKSLRKLGRGLEEGLHTLEEGVEDIEREMKRDVKEIKRAISGKRKPRKKKPKKKRKSK